MTTSTPARTITGPASRTESVLPRLDKLAGSRQGPNGHA